MTDVFISFIHEEKRVAEAVKVFLRAKLRNKSGLFLSSDMWSINAGEEWLTRIKQELATARVVLLMLNKNAVSRPWVNFEAGVGWLAGKVIMPVCFGGFRPDHLPRPYSDFLGLSLEDGDGPYRLVKSLYDHLELGLTPPPFVPYDEDVAKLRSALVRE